MSEISKHKCENCGNNNYLKDELADKLQGNEKQKIYRFKCLFCGFKNKVNKFSIIREININKLLK